jgi:hypothetical protein
MNISIKTVINNVNDILIRTVLPDLTSGVAKRQLAYAIDMLNQLTNRVDYLESILRDDFDTAKAVFDLARGALADNRIDIPDGTLPEIKVQNFGDIPESDMHDAIKTMEAASSAALEVLYAGKSGIENFNVIENKVFDTLMQWNQRKAQLLIPAIRLEHLESA